MAQISYISSKIWLEKPTMSEFVEELVRRYKVPKYVVKICFAYNVVYFAYIERKIYCIFYSEKLNGWIMGFMHTSAVKRNFIPIIEEAFNALDIRRS
jgi:hypothetical protein